MKQLIPRFFNRWFILISCHMEALLDKTKKDRIRSVVKYLGSVGTAPAITSS